MARSFYGRRPLWYWPQRWLRGLFVALAMICAVASLVFWYGPSAWFYLDLGAVAVFGGLAWLLGWRD